MGKFSRTWKLMKSSAHILRQDKELLVFPILSGIFMVLLIASFVAPLLGPGIEERIEHAGAEGEGWFYLAIFAFYVSSYFIVVFFNAAIIACALKRMDGGDPTIKYGLDASVERLPQIFAWALFAGTVGFLLRMIEARSAAAGRIVAAFLGIAWTVASYLAVPVLVAQRLGPIEAFRESARLLKRSWGEQIIGNFGFGVVFFVLSLLALPLFLIGSTSGTEFAVGTGVILAVSYLMLLAVVQTALQAIYQAAVYYYASSGEAPVGFDREALARSISAER